MNHPDHPVWQIAGRMLTVLAAVGLTFHLNYLGWDRRDIATVLGIVLAHGGAEAVTWWRNRE